MKKLTGGLIAIGLLVLTALPAAAQAPVLWGASPFENEFYSINQTTAAALSTRAVTLPGFAVTGINALSFDPSSGLVYIIVKVTGGRRLATLDLATGNATSVGPLADNFSSLAFTSSGVLYAVTGDGATVPETLYTLNKTTAAATFVLTLGNGADGEVIAFNPVNGLMYHWSGNSVNIFESINLTTLVVTPIAQSGDTHGEVFGAVWNPLSGNFFISDISSRLLRQSIGGAVTLLGTDGADDYRGLALITPAPVNGIPTLSQWGMILLTGLLLFFGASKLKTRATA